MWNWSLSKKYYLMKTMEANRKGGSSDICLPCFLALCFFLNSFSLSAQSDSTHWKRKKLNTLMIASGAAYTAGLVILNHVWYRHTERQSFRFFNDNAEWKQVDKAGHFFASFYLSDVTARMLKSGSVNDLKANVAGALTGFLLTLPIEVLDGFSDGYGASMGDVVANAVGPAFFVGQQLLWQEVRVHPKFSFHRTNYAPLRPALLGDNPLSEIVKDYNGQTYWLSVDVDKFTPFPGWLNISFGYGMEDMIYARDAQNTVHGFTPRRQYYLGVDLDLSGIRTRSRLLKALLYVVNTVRLPAPAIEFSRAGTKFQPFYF
jgi:uncharacterized protein YfiM (DUF2279 family)